MFKKKKNEVAEENKSLWDDPNAVELHYLQVKADLNESQHTQKVIDNGEYLRTGEEIEKYIHELEVRQGFDEMMGNPLEKIDGMFKGCMDERDS